MSTSTRSMATIIREAMDYRLSRVHVCMPAVVRAYDATTQLADCEPIVKSRIALQDGGILEEDYPVIPDVPVAWPRAGNAYLHMPLAAGDLVTLVFSEQSFDQARRTADYPSSPLTIRRHDLADAIAMPNSVSGTPISGLNSSNISLTIGGVGIHIKPDGTISLGIETAAGTAAVAEKVATELAKIVPPLQILGAELQGIMTVLSLGPSPTAAALVAAGLPLLPAPATWPASTASSKVKVTP